MIYSDLPIYSGPPMPSKDERAKQTILRMYYAALSKELGIPYSEAEKQVKNNSIPCDIETIKRFTGYYPWELQRA